MKLILSFLFLLMLGPGLFYLDGAILKDLSLKSETLSPANIATHDRKCRSKVFVFQSCSYEYTYNDQEMDQSYFFVSFGPPETLMLLKGDESGRLTSDVGQDYLWNRILFVLFCPGLALWSLAKILSNRRQQVARPLRHSTPGPQRVAAPSLGRPTGRTTFGKRR